MKNPLTPVGIEPATFRFIAHHLNYCAIAVPEAENSIVNNASLLALLDP